MPATASTTSFQSLENQLAGRVSTAHDADWDQARQAFNLAVDQRPAAVVLPADARDVIAVVRFAREHGLRVAPQATGHNAGPLSLEDTILLKTSEMRGGEIDPARRRARVNAGAQWRDVIPAAAEHGLAALHGSAQDVGIVGYSLGGGIGWYARKHGLAANKVTAIGLVTAEGRQVRVDADSDPDLFWALRGGGGANFGIVTSLEFELLPITAPYAGMFVFDWERSEEVLHVWHELTSHWPDEITTTFRILQIPDIPDIPEMVRGRNLAVVNGVVLDDPAAADELLAPLRGLGPELDTWGTVPADSLVHLHMDPPDPVPGMSGASRLLRRLEPSKIDELVALTGPGSGSPLMGFELRHTGGALARAPRGGGAVSKLDGELLSFAFGMVMAPEMVGPLEAHLARVDDAISGAGVGRYSNFSEEKVEMAELYGEQTLARLQRVRAAYDPDGLFRANHEIAAG
ncbi:MAG: FAD-binding oxidoreductase [Solirubrobacterales bacterium]